MAISYDVSGQPTGTTFKGQAVREELLAQLEERMCHLCHSRSLKKNAQCINVEDQETSACKLENPAKINRVFTFVYKFLHQAEILVGKKNTLL